MRVGRSPGTGARGPGTGRRGPTRSGAARAAHPPASALRRRCRANVLSDADPAAGKYGALVWDESKQSWEADPALQVGVHVEDLSSASVVTNTKGPHTGTFTFASHDAADHQICLSAEAAGWAGHRHVKMYLDVNVGPSKHDKE